MPYDFDTPVDRYGTDCLKFDHAEARGRRSDLLSLWVADMDFQTAPEIINALCERAKHGIFGYTEPGPAYFAAHDAWCAEHYGWHAPAEQMALTPGVVYALATAVRAFTEPGDAVVVQQPVYYPFTWAVEINGRRVANATLAFDGQRYYIDFEAFERLIVETGAKLYLLCNPHNPVGRAWSPDELSQLAEICARHGVVIASDEIHMDFARPGCAHTSLATAGDTLEGRYAVFTSASKTFNLAGLQVANAFIPDDDLRRAFRHEISVSGYSQPNALGLVATQAAYEHGSQWLAELKDYLEGNWALLASMLASRTPSLRLIEAESTYLAWIDCRALGLDAAALERFVEDEAGLWLDCGHIFGEGGEGFIRINVATQRAYLQRAIDQLCTAIEKRLG